MASNGVIEADERKNEPWQALTAQQRVVETILFVLLDSELVVGSSALRSVMQRQIDVIVWEGGVRLQGIWDAVAIQPGFSAEKAYPPFCRLRTLEAWLGPNVELPRQCLELDEEKRHKHAKSFKLDEKKLIARLNTVAAPPPPEPAKNATPAVSEEAPRRSYDDDAPELLSTGQIVKIALLSLVTLGAIAGSVYYTFVARAGDVIPVASLSTEIPLHSARRYGNAATAVLRDEEWVRREESERRAHLEAALAKARAAGMDRVIIQNGAGDVRAMIVDEGGKPVVLFP